MKLLAPHRSRPGTGARCRHLLLPLLAVASVSAACDSSTSGPEPDAVADVASIEVQGPDTATYVVLAAGETAQLLARPLDRSGNPVDRVRPTWSSSNPAVAEVDQDGLVTARARGSAKIAARVDTVSAYGPVVVAIPGVGVRLECDPTPDQDVAAARERVQPLWFEQPWVGFSVPPPGGPSFNWTSWNGGWTCLAPHHYDPTVSDYVNPADLVMDFPGGAWLLSFAVTSSTADEGLIARAEVTFADGTSKTVWIEGVEDGAHVLAGVDLTDEKLAVRRVHVHDFYPLFYHRLRFYSGLPPGS